jgi:hypothetical protein
VHLRGAETDGDNHSYCEQCRSDSDWSQTNRIENGTDIGTAYILRSKRRRAFHDSKFGSNRYRHSAGWGELLRLPSAPYLWSTGLLHPSSSPEKHSLRSGGRAALAEAEVERFATCGWRCFATLLPVGYFLSPCCVAWCLAASSACWVACRWCP